MELGSEGHSHWQTLFFVEVIRKDGKSITVVKNVLRRERENNAVTIIN